MTKYNSKIGKGILIFLIISLGGSSILMIYQKAWFGVAIISSVGIFIAYIFSSTKYTISDQVLKIECGFLVNISIRVDSIKRISKSQNFISSPANSLDRLEIRYNLCDMVLVSPKNKIAFVQQLKEINPNIELKGFA